MHLSPTINLGEVIGWLLGGAGLMFTLGVLKQRLVGVEEKVDEHREDFRAHEASDDRRFTELTAALIQRGDNR